MLPWSWAFTALSLYRILTIRCRYGDFGCVTASARHLLENKRDCPLTVTLLSEPRSRLFGSALATSRPLKGVVTTSALQPSSPHCHGEHLSHHSPPIRCRAGTGPMQSPSRQKVNDRQLVPSCFRGHERVGRCGWCSARCTNKRARAQVSAYTLAAYAYMLAPARHATRCTEWFEIITDCVTCLRCKCTSWQNCGLLNVYFAKLLAVSIYYRLFLQQRGLCICVLVCFRSYLVGFCFLLVLLFAYSQVFVTWILNCVCDSVN